MPESSVALQALTPALRFCNTGESVESLRDRVWLANGSDDEVFLLEVSGQLA
jgi:hypothetical protein